MNRSKKFHVVWLCLLLLALPSFAFAQQKSFATEDSWTQKSAPDDCVFFASWEGFGGFSPEGGTAERWYAQPEIQEFMDKIEEALTNLPEDLLGEEEEGFNEGVALGTSLFFTLVENPGSLSVEKLKLEGKEKKILFVAALDLADRSKKIQKISGKLVAAAKKNPNLKYQSSQLAGVLVHQIKLLEPSVSVCWSFDGSRLFIADSPKRVSDARKRIQTPQPTWLAKLKEKLKAKKVNTVTFLDLDNVVKQTASVRTKEFDRFLKKSKLDGIDQMAFVTDLVEEGTQVKGFLSFGSAEQPFLKIFPETGWTKKELSEVSDQENYLFGLKIDTKQLLSALDYYGTAAGGQRDIDLFWKDMGSSGVDVKKFIKSIGPSIRINGRFLMPNPLISFQGKIDIRNLAEFKESFKQIKESTLKAAEEMAEFMPDSALPKVVKKNGFELITSGRGMLGGSFCIGHTDKFMAFGFSPRKVVRLLKGSRVRGDITNRLFMKRALEYGDGNGPVAITCEDIRPALRALIPLLQGFAGNGPLIPGTNLNVGDIPSADVLTNGLQPSVGAMYRSGDSLVFFGQTSNPVPSPALFIGLPIGMVMPAVMQAQDAASTTNSLNNLKMIGLALQMHHDTYRHIPTQYSVGKDGEKLLSWRVHILPFIEPKLYKKFRLDQPWDSEHNIKMLKEMPDFLKDPRFETEEGKTTYLGVIGPAGAIVVPKDPKQKGTRMRDFTDGTSNTICVVQVQPKHAVPWTAPEDFDYTKKGAEKLLHDGPIKRFAVAFADGSTRTMAKSVPWDLLKKMFTKNAGDIFFLED